MLSKKDLRELIHKQAKLAKLTIPQFHAHLQAEIAKQPIIYFKLKNGQKIAHTRLLTIAEYAEQQLEAKRWQPA